MNFENILKHCVIIEVSSCKDEKKWYANNIGEQFVAFAIDEDEEEIHVCHKDNNRNIMASVPVKDCKFVQGSIDDLWEMS